MKQTAPEVRMDEKVRQFYELGKSIKATENLKRDLQQDIDEWMADEEALDVEGLPTLRRKTRSLGKFWDSDAIRRIVDSRPEEWRKLVELGCVRLDPTAISQCIERGQLVGTPEGFIEHRSKPFLVFDR